MMPRPPQHGALRRLQQQAVRRQETYTRHDISCGFSGCDSCAAISQTTKPLRNMHGHVVVPDGDVLAFFHEVLAAGYFAASDVLLMRSAYERGCGHPLLRRRREVQQLLAHPGPHQRVAVFEDGFHADAAAACTAAAPALLALAAEGGGAGRGGGKVPTAAARSTSPPAIAAAPAPAQPPRALDLRPAPLPAKNTASAGGSDLRGMLGAAGGASASAGNSFSPAAAAGGGDDDMDMDTSDLLAALLGEEADDVSSRSGAPGPAPTAAKAPELPPAVVPAASPVPPAAASRQLPQLLPRASLERLARLASATAWYSHHLLAAAQRASASTPQAATLARPGSSSTAMPEAGGAVLPVLVVVVSTPAEAAAVTAMLSGYFADVAISQEEAVAAIHDGGQRVPRTQVLGQGAQADAEFWAAALAGPATSPAPSVAPRNVVCVSVAEYAARIAPLFDDGMLAPAVHSEYAAAVSFKLRDGERAPGATRSAQLQRLCESLQQQYVAVHAQAHDMAAAATAMADAGGLTAQRASLQPPSLGPVRRRRALWPPHAAAAVLESWASAGTRQDAPCRQAAAGQRRLVIRGVLRAHPTRGDVAFLKLGRLGAGSGGGAAQDALADSAGGDGREVVVCGRLAMNRAMDGDEVVVEAWRPREGGGGASSNRAQGARDGGGDDDGDTGIHTLAAPAGVRGATDSDADSDADTDELSSVGSQDDDAEQLLEVGDAAGQQGAAADGQPEPAAGNRAALAAGMEDASTASLASDLERRTGAAATTPSLGASRRVSEASIATVSSRVTGRTGRLTAAAPALVQLGRAESTAATVGGGGSPAPKHAAAAARGRSAVDDVEAEAERTFQLHPGQLYGRVLGITRRRAKPIVATVPMPADELTRLQAAGGGAGGIRTAADAFESALWRDPATQGSASGASTGSTSSHASAIPASAAAPQPALACDAFVLAIPMDPRLPKVRLRTRQLGALLGQRILVAVDDWADDSAYPTGHYVGTVGRALAVDTEVRCVMLATDVDAHARPFPPAALACLPPLPSSRRWGVAWDRYHRLVAARPPVLAALLAAGCGSGDAQAARQQLTALAANEDRRDLRWSHPVCSVDPPGCTDIDDALSVRPLPGGRIEVGVHIADVSHFVAHGGDLDVEARARGTTVYLVDRRLDMLPGLLSENVCSLRARVDRYALSVLWELEPVADAKAPAGECGYRIVPGGVWMGRSIIRSTHALTYDQAKHLIAGSHADGTPLTARVAATAAASGGTAAPAADPTAADMETAAARLAGPLPPSFHEWLDEAAYEPAATARREHDAAHYPADPPSGGLCGASVHRVDEPALAQRLRTLTSVAHWLNRRRGKEGLLELDSAELRFKLRRKGSGGAQAFVGAAGPPSEAGDVPTSGADVPAAAAATDQSVATSAGGSSSATGEDRRGGGESGGADDEVEPVAVVAKHSEDINNTIAELMIFANEATAKLAYRAFPAVALLRRHAEAEATRFAALAAAATAAGFTVDATNKATLAASLQAIAAQLAASSGTNAAGKRTPQAALLQALTTRALTRAEYFATGDTVGDLAIQPVESQPPLQLRRTPGGGYVPGIMDVPGPAAFGHYGLGLRLYTHFTSPIRRYADLVVHRLVTAALGVVSFGAPLGPATGAGAVAPASRAQGRPPLALKDSAPSALAIADVGRGDARRPMSLADHLAPSAAGGLFAQASIAPAPRAHVAAAGEDDGDALLEALLADGEEISAPPPQSAAPSAVRAGPAPQPARAASGVWATQPVGIRAAADAAHNGHADGDVDMAAGQGSQDAGAAVAAATVASAPSERAAALSAEPGGPPFPLAALLDVASHLNERNQAAKIAGWECDELFLALYLKNRVVVLEAVVSAVRAWGLAVYIPQFGVSAQVHLGYYGGGGGGGQRDGGVAAGSQQLADGPAAAGGAIGRGGGGDSDSDSSDAVPAVTADIAVPPALFGLVLPDPAAAATPGTGLHNADPASRALYHAPLPKTTAAVLARLPPADRAALLREGAVRVPIPGAARVLGAPTVLGGPASATLTLQPPASLPAPLVRGQGARGAAAAGAGAGVTLRVMDRVMVALTCVYDLHSARRPALRVDLVADTPAVRRLAAAGTAGTSVAPATKAAAPASAAPHPGTPAPAPEEARSVAPRRRGRAATVPCVSLYSNLAGDATAEEEARSAESASSIVGVRTAAASPFSTAVLAQGELSALAAAAARGAAGPAAAGSLLPAIEVQADAHKALPTRPTGGRASSAPAHPALPRGGRHMPAPTSGPTRLASGRARYGGYAPPAELRPDDAWTAQHGRPGMAAAAAAAAAEWAGSATSSILGGDYWAGRQRPGGAAGGGAAAPVHVDQEGAAGPRWAQGPAADASASAQFRRGREPGIVTGWLDAPMGDGEVSAYRSRSGAGLSGAAVAGSFDAIRSAEAAARARAMKLSAEKRHDRIDKKKKAERG